MNQSDIDKLNNIPSNLSSVKSKVVKLDVAELVAVPVDLSKLTDVVKDVVEKDVHNIKIKNIKHEIPDITNLNVCMFLSCHVRVSE